MPKTLCVNVVVVGGGLGGLSAAIAIARGGHKVTVVERSPQLGEIGAGIQVPPNATRILDRWGILEKLRPNAMEPESNAIRSYADDSILSLLHLNPSLEKIYGYPYLHVHRATFHKTLSDEAARLGVMFKLGTTVTGIDFEKSAVKTRHNKDMVADFIIGADGLKSVCREALLGRLDPPRVTGDMAYRVVIDVNEMKRHNELINYATRPIFNHWAGPGGQSVGYLVENGTIFNLVIVIKDELPDGVYTMKGDLNELQEKLKSWNPRFKLLLKVAKETTIWKLLNSIEMEAWTHPNGNFTLLGDACHATLPYLSQGAAQAIEDGAVLGALFDKAETKSEIRDALGIYEKLRKPRTTRIVRGSTEFGARMTMQDGEAQRERDRQMTQCVPFEGYPNMMADPVVQKYLFSYDADVEVAEGWGLYKAGKAVEE